MPTEHPNATGESLLVQRSAGVWVLLLNRPDRRNALTPDLARAVTDQITSGGSDTSVSAVVLRGAGGHFCVGLDLKWLEAEGGLTPAMLEEGLAAFQGVVRAIVDCPIPVVAALEGSVAGIGIDIAAACDIRLAADSASFHSAFAKMGLVPDGGSTFTLPRLVGQGNALRLLLAGAPVDAARAREMGLVGEVHPAARFDGAIAQLIDRLRGQSRHSLVEIKQLVRREERAALDEHLLREGRAQIASLGSPEFAERLRSFTKGRDARPTS